MGFTNKVVSSYARSLAKQTQFYREKGYPIEKKHMEKEVRGHLYKEGFRGHDLDTMTAWKINNSDRFHFGQREEENPGLHRQLFGNMIFDTINYYRK